MARDYAKYRTRSRRGNRNSVPGVIWLLIGVLLGLIMAGVIYIKGLHNRTLPALTQTLPTHTTHGVRLHEHKHAIDENNSAAPRFDFYTILPKMKVWVPANQGQSAQAKRDIIIPSPELKGHGEAADDTPKVTTPKHLIRHDQDERLPKEAQTDEVAQSTPKHSAKKSDAQKPQHLAKTDPVRSAQNQEEAFDQDEVAPRHLVKPQDETKHTLEKTKHVAVKDTAAKKPRYLVQAQAVNSAAEADRLKAQLLLAGFDIHVKSTPQGHTRLYLGPYNSREQAQSARERLALLHINGVLVKE